MAQVRNETSGTLQIFAKGSEIGPKKNNYQKTLAAGATGYVPDDVVGTDNVQELLNASSITVLSYETDDTAPVNAAELRSLVKGVAAVCSAGTSTVIADTGVKAGDTIIIQAADSAFAALTGVFVDDANIVDNTSFQVDHSAASGGEKFTYIVRSA